MIHDLRLGGEEGAPFASLDSMPYYGYDAVCPEGADAPFAGLRAVVVGGGTGSTVSIRALLALGFETSCVVAMADDGGSTGRLREAADVTAPGDVRKCIAAFAADTTDPLAQMLDCRVYAAAGHSLGNLVISTLEDITGSFPAAIAACERLVGARGHVYPSTLSDVSLVAQTVSAARLDGQFVATESQEALERIVLEAPAPIEAYEPAVRALEQADLIVLGPGSLFTSVIANLAVPGIAEAIDRSDATVVFASSVADAPGETAGLSVMESLEALECHGLEDRIDAVLAEVPDDAAARTYAPPVFDDVQRADLARRGICVIAREFANPDHDCWHLPTALAAGIAEAFSTCRSPRR